MVAGCTASSWVGRDRGQPLPGEVDQLAPPPQQEQFDPFVLEGGAVLELEDDTAPPAAQCLPHHHVAVAAA